MSAEPVRIQVAVLGDDLYDVLILGPGDAVHTVVAASVDAETAADEGVGAHYETDLPMYWGDVPYLMIGGNE
jgi:hypothetical protein